MSARPLFNRIMWAEKLRNVMASNEATVRAVEAESGVSKATVSRVSRADGVGLPDVETYLRLNAWMAEANGADPACPDCGAPSENCCAWRLKNGARTTETDFYGHPLYPRPKVSAAQNDCAGKRKRPNQKASIPNPNQRTET